MSYLPIKWKANVNWEKSVSEALSYFETHKNLKFGNGKAFIVIDHLCKYGAATRKEIMEKTELNKSDISTILSNVTMAIQKQKNVHPPELGGWRVTIRNPYTYIVCPGFADAWLKAFKFPIN